MRSDFLVNLTYVSNLYLKTTISKKIFGDFFDEQNYSIKKFCVRNEISGAETFKMLERAFLSSLVASKCI